MSCGESVTSMQTNQRLRFLTNNFTLPALTIAQIYKCRWQVELFFKWIKQHLRIKAFYGTSENAVKTQIWIAVSVYVLVAIIRKRLGLKASLYQILQILSLTLFEKTPVLQALQSSSSQTELDDPGNQLILFDFWPDSSECRNKLAKSGEITPLAPWRRPAVDLSHDKTPVRLCPWSGVPFSFLVRVPPVPSSPGSTTTASSHIRIRPNTLRPAIRCRKHASSFSCEIVSK